MYTWGLLPTETEVRGGWKAEGDGGERIHTYVLRQGVVLTYLLLFFTDINQAPLFLQ